MDKLIFASFLLASTGCASGAAQVAHPVASPAPGSKRTELVRADLSAPGREVRQVRVDFAPQYEAPKHSHPGEEVVYVIEGTLEYRVGDAPPKTYSAGEVLVVPAGTIHSARNVGPGNAAELATYIVVKNKPLIVSAD